MEKEEQMKNILSYADERTNQNKRFMELLKRKLSTLSDDKIDLVFKGFKLSNAGIHFITISERNIKDASYYSNFHNLINLLFVDPFFHELGHAIFNKWIKLPKIREFITVANFEFKENYEKIKRIAFQPLIDEYEEMTEKGSFENIYNNLELITSYGRSDVDRIISRGAYNENELLKILNSLKQNDTFDDVLRFYYYMGDRRIKNYNMILSELLSSKIDIDIFNLCGHDTKFYNQFNDGKIASNELFANLFEAYIINQSDYNEAREYLPTTYILFEKLIELLREGE